MSDHTQQEFPYKSLGSRLKRLREKKQASIAEVSGAVEIDAHVLSEIERGARRPSEDVLLLLISYFSASEDVATRLWDLAGYDKPDTASSANDASSDTAQQVMVLPIDARIVYTDMAHVVSNKYGVTVNFMQSVGLGGQPLAVARVGMSREHAQHVLELLQKALAPSTPKLLPAPDNSSDNKPTTS